MSLRDQKVALIVEDLLREGFITVEKRNQINTLQNEYRDTKTYIDQILVQNGFISQQEMGRRLAAKAGVEWVDLSNIKVTPMVLYTLSEEQAKKWHVVPVEQRGASLVVATADPFDMELLDVIQQALGVQVEFVLASLTEIEHIIETQYEKIETKEPKKTFHGHVRNLKETSQNTSKPLSDEERVASQVVFTVDELLKKSIMERASDIHLEPTRKGLQVRVRIDGVLNTIAYLPQDLQESILSRVKILGGMDVAEHRVPQDGRTTLALDGKEIDVRIAVYPTLFGEAAAIRLLSKAHISFDDLGLYGRDREELETLIHRPNGIFLVTGPTGSGKTTTLYAALQKIDRHSRHVLSVEDPIENEIEGVDQTQVNVKAGVTFASAVRAMLRQDPDVIMVGEIRDQETADIALRAAMTGHLVLSTLHTNSAVGSIARLLDLGLESYLIANTLLAVLAQRLVRCICKNCKEEVVAQPVLIKSLGPRAEGIKTYHGKGCSECRMRGFKGRIGIFELVVVDEEFRVLINNHAPEIRLKEKALSAGFRTMLDDGIDKIHQGITTVEEVLRACGNYGG